ncbi:hypothetical protein S83_025794, partial [Arachis hypogaea]
LVSKPTRLFYSTGLLGGGQETILLTAITMLAHHGMIYVPIGYMFRHCMFKMKEVKGGSLYGAGTYVGDGTRQVLRLNCCKHSTGRIFLPPSPRSSRMLHKAYN